MHVNMRVETNPSRDSSFAALSTVPTTPRLVPTKVMCGGAREGYHTRLLVWNAARPHGPIPRIDLALGSSLTMMQ